MCNTCSWYDTLNNKYNTYYGYWCFESAAIAEILALPKAKFMDNVFFPYI
ncbi:PoNe immunity protein domain-containing protein [Paludicola sp. MB14-C6]